MSRRARAFVAVSLIACLSSGLAGAQPSMPDRALAQQLFDEGRTLMTAGGYAEACRKFAESQRLDPGAGTFLNLAFCHEKEGKSATAWTELHEALSQALKDGRTDREELARERIAAIGPTLAHLRIKTRVATSGLVLELDGARLASADEPIPVDPGNHVLVAKAPGKLAWSSTVAIPASPETATLEVPPLEDEPVIVAAPSKDAPGTPRKTTALVVGGAGLVAIGVGTVFGIRSLQQRADSDRACPISPCATQEGVSLNDQAIVSAWISDVALGVGIVAVGVGTYLFLTAPPSKRASVRLVPAMAPGYAGASVAGSF